MGRGLMGWGDLTARRRDFAPGLGGCQRGVRYNTAASVIAEEEAPGPPVIRIAVLDYLRRRPKP